MRDSTVNSVVLTALVASAGVAWLRHRGSSSGRDTTEHNSSKHMAAFRDPPATGSGVSAAREYTPLTRSQAERSVEHVRALHEDELMKIPGVTGVGIGQSPNGDEAILVHLVDSSASTRVPRQIDGFPVETVVTGQIEAY